MSAAGVAIYKASESADLICKRFAKGKSYGIKGFAIRRAHGLLDKIEAHARDVSICLELAIET
jgi:hypothetical protein